MSSTSRASPPHKPLIQSAKNSWQKPQDFEKWGVDYKHIADYDSEDGEEYDEKLRFRNPSPRSRRQILLFIVLALCAWTTYVTYLAPWRVEIVETAAVDKSVVEDLLRQGGGGMAAHRPPAFDSILLLETLDEKYVPTNGKQKHREGRLIVVGDVHGMKSSLIKLLDTVKFDKENDHLILAGDMISKGPDSVGVLDLLIEMGESASAVRGNHEDRVLLAWDSLHSRVDLQSQVDVEGDDGAEPGKDSDKEMGGKGKKGEQKDKTLAKQLSHKHVQWLKKLPIILRVGEIKGMGEVVVVHAGLVPGLELMKQDPYYVMNMRTMDLDTKVPSDGREGIPWTKVWLPSSLLILPSLCKAFGRLSLTLRYCE